MLELMVVAAATTGLFALAKGIRGTGRLDSGRQVALSKLDDRAEDLPCPWCYSPTTETDRHCGGCGRAFG